MQLILQASDVINGQTYLSKTFTVEADECRSPIDAEDLILQFTKLAEEGFDKIRDKMRAT
jgi:hypothetical protein